MNQVDVTTRIADEANILESNLAPTSMNSSIVEAGHDYGVNTIKDFLEKPSLIASGVFQTSDVAGTALNSYTLPATMLQFDKQTTKLNGVNMFRADIEVSLKVNATRFQQGRYFLRVVYTGGASVSVSTNKLAGAHVGNLMVATSANTYEIDLATMTSITFTIPYTSVSNYTLSAYGAVSGHDFAKMYLIPYDPLAAGSGDTTCQWSLWARFVNITLSGAVVLQSRSVTLKEARNGGVGPITAIADKVSKSASILGEIPLLTAAASTVSWMSSLVGRVATLWGFSKPTIVNPATAISRQALPQFGNADGAAVAHKLALTTTNEVPITTGRSRTNADELSIEFIARQSAWIYTVNWADTATSGTVLFNKNVVVGPSADTIALYKGYTVTPLDYISSLFKAYRVAVKYKFKIPKTEFHSGRLLIAWQPYDGTSAPGTISSLSDTDNLQRIIWDVRETNELEVEIPFILPTNYQKIGIAYAKIYILVVNELIAPSTVPSSVNILVEKSAGSVVEFAMPINTLGNTQYNQPHIFYQSAPITLGSSKSPPLVAAESFGESIVSLRSLLKRFSNLGIIGVAGPYNGTFVYPFEPSIVLQTTNTSGPLVRLTTNTDTFSLLAPLFAFNSGGMRVMMIQDMPSQHFFANITSVDATPVDVTGSITVASIPPSNPVAYVNTGIEGAVCVEVPQYTIYGARSVSNTIPGPATVFSSQPTALLGGTNMRVEFTSASSVSSASYPIFIFRAVADDFNMSCYNGVIPWVNSATS